MHLIKIKSIHVLQKLSFHNPSHSLIGHVIQELLFSCRKSLRFISAHIETVRFFLEMCVKNEKRRPKIITGYIANSHLA